MSHKKTTKEFITESKTIHNDKYDYSKVEYVNAKTKVCIICPEHGEFWQTPSNHLKGQGCPKCGGIYHYNTQEWIEEAKKIHKNKYDYSKVEYVNNKTDVCIICPEHGEFWQTPNTHLKGSKCPKCANIQNGDRIRDNAESFIKKAKKIHGDKYDYSKVEYIDSHTKVCIICPEHGEFWQIPNSHLRGSGCPICGQINRTKTKTLPLNEFIIKAFLVHGDKYDYSKVEYVNAKTKVCIMCPKHGEFWQTPDDHLRGKGCPKCNSSHMESEIRNILQENKINFVEQKKFDWLRRQSLDFYLPNYNIAIECQGKQHFEVVDYFGGEESLTEVNKRDQNKKQLCEKHNIKILYYANYDYDFPYEVFTDKNKLINEITWKKK